ncbi:sensor histidine kinase [Paenibacillus psychroresistens]|uniref:Sensor histidine kinase n=2 Tax=Paenibacillus psychroresistens TaxID=1778678 RepID=A0A6B8REZ9_9BACL|nr:sensor histidine kinase [Paenibacillus psychroresistens]
MTLRRKIIIASVLIVLLPLSFAGFYFYSSLSSILTNNAYDNLKQSIQQTTDTIESSFNSIDNTSLHFLSNKSIRSWISGDTFLEEDYYNLFLDKSAMAEELNYSMMFNTAWEEKLITTAYIFLNESTYISSSRSMQNVQIVEENNINIFKELARTNTRGIAIIPPTLVDKTIYFTRTLSSVSSPTQHLVIQIGTDESEVSNKYQSVIELPGSIAYIIDNRGVIYSSSDKHMLGKTVENSILQLKSGSNVSEATLNNQVYFVVSKEISDSGLTFFAGIPKNQVLAKLSTSIREYLLITLFIVFILLITSILLSLRFTRFIKDLLKSINKVKLGNYDVRMPEYKDMELILLSNTFNSMAREIKYLINQVYEKQLLVKESEFKFLQSQMNPHFLFNTLVTIGYKARLSQDETVFHMVTSLTELLQASIYSNSKDRITVRQEMEYIQFYLYLQKIRFEDKLDYRIHISNDAILDYYLPKLSVEPIVENALIHGLESKLGKGTVIIHIREDLNSLYFEIIDDGLGFNTSEIQLDDTESAVKRKKGHNNIGLSNTHKRIKLMYGEQYGLTLTSELNKGSRIIVHIPIDKGEAADV